jgi:transporter family-2 protein
MPVTSQPLALVVALVAGVAGGLQIAINGAFGRRIGFLEAASFASVLTMLAILGITIAVRHGLGGVADGFRTPAWLWLGGLGSAVLVVSVTFASPRIGALATGGLLIAGQLCVVVLADTFGWFGLDRVSLTPHRLLGLPLLAVSAVLILKR